MHKIIALLRANALQATSYRLGIVLSLLGLIGTIFPVYFVANALQPTMARTIHTQAPDYFAFVLIGIFVYTFIAPATTQIPNTISNGITTGTLEAMLGTSTGLPVILAGLSSYTFCWQMIRGGILLLCGALLGATLHWSHMLFGGLIVLLTVVTYLAIGILGAAMVLVFRTSGPLTPVVLALSGLLGGVYYPTHVIPSWLERVSAFVPLTYGLRALRRTVLNGESFGAVLPDVLLLAGFMVALLITASALFGVAYDHARRSGTLAHY